MRWHPDRFKNAFLASLLAEDRQEIMERVKSISQQVNLENSRKFGHIQI